MYSFGQVVSPWRSLSMCLQRAIPRWLPDNTTNTLLMILTPETGDKLVNCEEVAAFNSVLTERTATRSRRDLSRQSTG